MLIAMGVLALLTILMGVFPEQIVSAVIAPAADALIDQGAYVATVFGGI